MTIFEMAIDEMTYEAKIDPLQFRLLNYSDIDAMNGTPYTARRSRKLSPKARPSSVGTSDRQSHGR